MADSSIIQKLVQSGVVKIDFNSGWTLKSGIWSPIYINFRLLQSYPELLIVIVSKLKKMIDSKKIKFDRVASIPSAGVPLGVVLSIKTKKGHILPRMDSKSHGLKMSIDGVYKVGQKVLLVDDLITRSTSKIEAIKVLEDAGLIVKDVVVVLDRQQGGVNELVNLGYNIHCLFNIRQVLDVMQKKSYINNNNYIKICDYLKKTST